MISFQFTTHLQPITHFLYLEKNIYEKNEKLSIDQSLSKNFKYE